MLNRFTYSKGPSKPRVGGVHGCYTGRADKKFHHWGQDVDTARYYIDNFSAPGDIVLDPFIGGGTSAVACEILERKCISFDIDPVALCTTRDRLNGIEPEPKFPLLEWAARL